MIVGFTGTQYGCTVPQREALKKYLHSIRMQEFHHGDCVGADVTAHTLIVRRYPIVLHPSNVEGKRAYCRGAHRVEIIRLPLDRNRDIVQVSDLLVACPRQMFEEGRSGTWATVREAFRRGKKVTIVWPDGRVQPDATMENLPN